MCGSVSTNTKALKDVFLNLMFCLSVFLYAGSLPVTCTVFKERSVAAARRTNVKPAG